MSESRSPAVTIILVILGILFLAPGACGGFFFGAIVLEAMRSPGGWGSDAAAYGLMICGVASMSIVLSLILMGVLMRAGSWSWSRNGSLLIAIVSAVFVIASHPVLMMLTEGASETVPYVYLYTVMALCLSALPPYFHWRNGR